ncbi:PadR family transcriptional regulator [Alicyclobacillus dauci]|uniref:PadR family transcriptional regulator n=1 Tax=Alicyclobacillus dauci TaxID=1475485 RepID=A0ABY6Z2V8_9BACL|nr:PadR family transcriptional regulator [Alicyclobacillus dauci]
MDIDREVLKGYIDTILLSLLHKEPLYGYELVKRSRENSDGTFEIKEATLYLALKRTEKNGYTESYWDNSESGGGRRKYYKLTDEGRSRLQSKKSEWEYLKCTMDKFLGGVDL